ncbi:MAG TPA: hypothetical protein VFS34_02605, partial [Thermoanaerobaculia bacterium]|nr:hypothetical protein [Thermoanaerobaculia bacterium]
FRPTVRLGEGKFHRLKVTLRQKGLHVSARAGYYETRAYRTLNPLERSLLTADVINGGGARGEIPVGALAIPLAGSGIARVPVLIQVPASSLQDSKHSGRVRIAIYVYLTDADGGLADYFSRNLTIDLAREGARLSAGYLRYSGACRLLPGRYTLRALVQDEETGRYGFANASVNVPDYSGTRLQAFPPLFLGDEGRGLNLREPSSGGGGEEIFELGGAPFVPQIDPPIPASGDSKICLFVYRPHGDGDRPFDVDVEILGDDGKSRAPARVALIGRTTADTDGLTKLMLDFSVRDLPPGRYSLKVTVRDSREKALESSSEAPFTVS